MTALIVTDNHLFSIAIQEVIKINYPNACIVETNTLRKAIDSLLRPKCQMMILDIGVADAMDRALLDNFRKVNPQAAVLINLGDRSELMYKFIKAGVTALFSNKSSAEDIKEGLRSAENNMKYLSSDIQQQLLSHIIAKPINQTLNKREELVADLLLADHSHGQIALIAGITIKSVAYYKRRIFEKLEVKNLLDLALKLDKVMLTKAGAK